MKKLFVLAIFLLPSLALAEAAEQAVEGIPSSVIFQSINFLLYAVGLTYFLRKPIKKYFIDREEAFRQALIKAEAAKVDAEARRKEIEATLEDLQSTSADALAQARLDAETLRKRILADAEELSRNLQTEARRTAEFEIQRAKNELRAELLNQAVAMSTQILKDKMAEPDQKRLQTEFVDKIGAQS